jgi:hypothetical protein
VLLLFLGDNIISVAQPEPVERQHFAGAGVEVFWPGSCSGCVNVTKSPRFFILKFKVEFKHVFFIALIFSKKHYMGENGRSSKRSRNFCKLEPKPHKNYLAPHHRIYCNVSITNIQRKLRNCYWYDIELLKFFIA